MDKKIEYVWNKALCLFLICALSYGCTEKAPEYPDLEGYWKQERIEDSHTDDKEECNRLFWAFQLGIAEVKDLGGNGYGSYLCRYEYNEKAATLRMFDFRIKGNQGQQPDEEKLRPFGIPSGDVTFKVVSLNGDKMVLDSGETILYFRSF